MGSDKKYGNLVESVQQSKIQTLLSVERNNKLNFFANIFNH